MLQCCDSMIHTSDTLKVPGAQLSETKHQKQSFFLFTMISMLIQDFAKFSNKMESKSFTSATEIATHAAMVNLRTNEVRF